VTKIVIVEDNEIVRMTLRSLLTHAGFEVVGVARTGEMGLQMARKLKPGLVCLDISMPGMNGVDVLSALRTDFPEMPVVVVSGYTDRETIDKLRSLHVDGVVVKPFSPGRLVSAVQDALRARDEAKPSYE